MSGASAEEEPSMEDILASIRDIISDDEPGADAAPQAESHAKENVDESDLDALFENATGEADDDAPAGDPTLEEDNSQDDIDALFGGGDDTAEEPEPEEIEAVEAIEELEEVEEESPQEEDIMDLTEDLVEPDIEFAEDEMSSAPSEPADDMAQALSESSVPEMPDMSSALEGDMGNLLSPQANEAVSGAFGDLANTILANNARTLDDLVQDMLRPMLKTWLDDNLPPLVERLVRDEIERVSRGTPRK